MLSKLFANSKREKEHLENPFPKTKNYSLRNEGRETNKENNIPALC